MTCFTTITPAFEQACQHWLLDSISQVEPTIEVRVAQFPEIEGNGDFQSDSFNWHNREKNRMIRSWIQEHHGGTIFVTDADIIYFRPFLDQLREDLGEAKLAFACKRMGEGCNIGQMVIRCDDEVLDFFEQIDARLERGEWDKQAVNDLLRTSPLPRRNFSRLFTDTSSWAALDDSSRLAAFSYHATETFPTAHTTSLEEKQKRIDEVLHWRELWRSDTPV